MCRWHHPYGRKQRRTKEPLDESKISQAQDKFQPLFVSFPRTYYSCSSSLYQKRVRKAEMQITLVSQIPKTERAGGGRVEENLRVCWLSPAEGWWLDMRICDYISIICLFICLYSLFHYIYIYTYIHICIIHTHIHTHSYRNICIHM